MPNNIKISIGTNIIEGPWGGGNQFAKSLSSYLKIKGWKVVTDLEDQDIDIILMTEPRITSATSAYNQLHIAKYVFRHPDTIVVHRINECDERKNTKYVNRYLARANKTADFTIFISEFLMKLFLNHGYFKNRKLSYVRNGADPKLFNMSGKMPWDGETAIKIVTHHWAYNYFKGFDIYEKIGRLHSLKGHTIDFTYIGRLPEDIGIGNTKVIPPLFGAELAKELKNHHIYVTGSINEPAGMHHIEGVMCGLPVLYRNSGALPEYCRGFGVMFEGPADFEQRLLELIDNYAHYYKHLESYPYNSDYMCSNYSSQFEELINDRGRIINPNRRLKYLSIFISEVFMQFFEMVTIKLKKLKQIRKVFNAKKII